MRISLIGIVLASALAVGCGGAPNPPASATQTASRFGKAGGALQTASGTVLQIPESALAVEVEIKITESSSGKGKHVEIEVQPAEAELHKHLKLKVKLPDDVKLEDVKVRMSGKDGDKSLAGVPDDAEHAIEIEVDDFGSFDVDDPAERATTCDPACATGFECDDGACKEHREDTAGQPGDPAPTTPTTCNPVCSDGFECDDGMCKEHGGGHRG
jgi:hypothetical protein